MKILELRFKNLNSLYGEWRIDFTHPEYDAGGIFALTGATGAGKSTVLDAVCLALYGATPRLGKITKSSNEIMSRRTGECYAEVLFSAQSGVFRCHWAQHRSRRKSSGELQNPRHEIACGDGDGQIIEHQIRRVAMVVEQKTGMDFDRFTRSILLAQGGFDTFLRADIEEKSKLLEQITGTEMYSRISQRVHERRRGEQEHLQKIEMELQGIAVLTSEQREDIGQKLQQREEESKVQQAARDKVSEAVAWSKGIAGLRAEIEFLVTEEAELEKEREGFTPDRKRLEQALAAVVLEGQYGVLAAERGQQKNDEKALVQEETKFPEVEKAFVEEQERLSVAEKATGKVKEELRAAAPRLQKIRALDQQLITQKLALKKEEDACQKIAEKIGKDEKGLRNTRARYEQAKDTLQNVERYLKSNARDEWLVGGYAGIAEQLERLLAMKKELDLRKIALDKAQKALSRLTGNHAVLCRVCEERRGELDDGQKRLQEKKESLGALLKDRLLREYRAEKDGLLREMAYLHRITELEAHRNRLEDGKPCPLCGSPEHPFARGNIPSPNDTETRIDQLSDVIEKAETLEKDIGVMAEVQENVLRRLAEAEKAELAVLGEKKAAEKNLDEQTSGLEMERKRLAELEGAILNKLVTLEISGALVEDPSRLLEELRSRREKWQQKALERGELEKGLAIKESDCKQLEAVIATQKEAQEARQEELSRLLDQYARGLGSRQENYGIINPDEEERRLNGHISDAEKVERKIRNHCDSTRQSLTAITTSISSLKNRIDKRRDELARLEAAFISSLQQAGFAAESAFLAVRLDGEERKRLADTARTLDEKRLDLLARKKDRATRLSAEEARKLTELPLEELACQLGEHEENLKRLAEEIAGCRHALAEDAKARERVKGRLDVVQQQKKECARWDRLHELIGSADGKKYRNFAQGLTFELLISHANQQLAKMTDRYLLVRDDLQPLELNVIDNYQAGEVRSTRNLSGGESFVVSLTLALGLSRMASRNVRVDSLFLDEGFGTLDEDALETALATLASLQQGDKLVGVISHVSALKERIPTQINVTPMSGGKSTLSGPGCARISA